MSKTWSVGDTGFYTGYEERYRQFNGKGLVILEVRETPCGCKQVEKACRKVEGFDKKVDTLQKNATNLGQEVDYPKLLKELNAISFCHEDDCKAGLSFHHQQAKVRLPDDSISGWFSCYYLDASEYSRGGA